MTMRNFVGLEIPKQATVKVSWSWKKWKCFLFRSYWTL